MVPRFAGGLLMLGFGLMELLRRGETAKKLVPSPVDRGTSALIVVAYALAVVAVSSRLLPVVMLPAPEVVGWLGVAIGMLGFTIRVWSMRVLGRFYTRTLVTTGDQKVVRTGPYRLVGHPGYLGSILVWTGAAATSCNALSLLAVLALLFVAYTHRIRSEERMLVDALGEPYAEYRRHSWRLVPFVF
jgi:protein-S-isoprenylcysteine O-methyltransferase Ste14